MKLSDTPINAALAAFSAPTPTPGGGSASALAGALGASLLTMVASMPKHRAASEEDVDRLQAAARRCADLGAQLAALADEDSAAYDAVVSAYRLPKSTDDEKAARSARIQEALGGAIEVPLEVMRRTAAALEAAATIAAFGNPQASSDVGVALELLRAAQRGARLNVEINLSSVKDAAYAGKIRMQIDELSAEGEAAIAAALGRLPPAG